MVQIITDSSVMYTEDEAKAMGFEAIPLCIHIGDLEGRDLQIDMEEFYRRIQKKHPKSFGCIESSAPTPEERRGRREWAPIHAEGSWRKDPSEPPQRGWFPHLRQ